MRIGWEEWEQDEKDEYRMRKMSTGRKKMKRTSTGWEEWALEANKNEKDEYRIRRVSTGWEDWVLEAKKMKRTSTGWEKWALEEKKWKGRVQDEKNEHWKKNNEKDEYRMSSEWEEGVVSMHILMRIFYLTNKG